MYLYLSVLFNASRIYTESAGQAYWAHQRAPHLPIGSHRQDAFTAFTQLSNVYTTGTLSYIYHTLIIPLKSF